MSTEFSAKNGNISAQPPLAAPAQAGERSPVQPPAVAILGLGLIGGSLLRDLTAAGWRAFGWNRSTSTVEAASAEGFDVSGDLTAVLQRAEQEDALLVVGVPAFALGGLFAAIAEHAPSCGVTDVTSVKEEVLEAARAAGIARRFVGSHPMAGTADSGWSATMTDLFRGAVWVIAHDTESDRASDATADAVLDTARGTAQDAAPDTAPSADARWSEIWLQVANMATTVGARIIPARARQHDLAVARISHMPHVVAEAVALAGANGGDLALSLAASSFRDITRVAGTSPDLVRAMVENNRQGVVAALDEVIASLAAARLELLSDPDADSQGFTELVDAGFAARGQFEARAGRVQGAPTARPVQQITVGADGWLEALDAAADAGAEIRVR